MSDAVQLQFRPIYQEDLATSATNAQVTDTVLGVGSVLLTPWVRAANDSAAAGLSIALGQIYWNTTINGLKARMT